MKKRTQLKDNVKVRFNSVIQGLGETMLQVLCKYIQVTTYLQAASYIHRYLFFRILEVFIRSYVVANRSHYHMVLRWTLLTNKTPHK